VDNGVEVEDKDVKAKRLKVEEAGRIVQRATLEHLDRTLERLGDF
jgi:hypothetical protein